MFSLSLKAEQPDLMLEQGRSVYALFSDWTAEGGLKVLGCVPPHSVLEVNMLGLPGQLAWHPTHQAAATAVVLPSLQGGNMPGWRWGLRIKLKQK